MSVQVPPNDAVAESGPEYVLDEQEAMPAVASVPWTSKAAGWLNHPAALAGRSGVAPVTDGLVSSYFRPYGKEALTFPALSLQVPDSDAPRLSGPLYVMALQLSTPDVWSVPLNVIPTGLLYQPLVPAARAGVPAVASGGV